MPRALTPVAACLFLFATGSFASDEWSARFDGIGPVRIGMTLPELNNVLNRTRSNPDIPDDQSCFYLEMPRHDGISLMILKGRVARIEVDDSAISTEGGIRIGDSEDQARQVYGDRLQLSANSYQSTNGHYLTVPAPSGGFGIRFETEQGKVVRYYAGTVSAISLADGCWSDNPAPPHASPLAPRPRLQTAKN